MTIFREILLSFSVLCFVFVGIRGEAADSKWGKYFEDDSSASVEQVESAQPKLDITYQQFIRGFNAEAKREKIPFEVKMQSLSKIGVNDDIRITKDMYLFFRYDPKTAKIEHVSLNSKIATKNQIDDFTKCMNIMIKVLSPKQNAKEIKTFSSRMMWDKDLGKIRPTRGEKVGKVSYVFNARNTPEGDECDFHASPAN